jgi:hypothetical protein
MSLSESLSSATDYLRRFFDRAGELLVLFILTLIPIVNILTLGYYGKVISEGRDSKQPPKLEHYADLFVKGLKYLAAIIIWAIPVIVAVIIAVIASFGPATYLATHSASGFNATYWQNLWQHFNSTNWNQFYNQYPATASAFLLTLIPSVIIVAIIAIIVGLFSFVGIVHMFKTGSFSKAFAFGEIFSIISKIGWLRYLGFVIMALILVSLAGIFGSIPLLGYFITIFLGLLVGIFLARTIGLMYDSAMGGTAQGASQPAAPSAPAPPETQAAGGATQSTVATTVFCYSCGAPNTQDAIYCNKCGKMLKK